MKISIVTLGCKVNQFESQALEAIFSQRGHEIVSSDESADVCIINTCAVTAESGRKSRQAARHAIARNPAALIAICGCWSQVSPDEAKELGAHIVAGSGDRRGFADEVEKAYEARKTALLTDDAMKRRVFEPLPAGRLHGRTRAMLKVQDGCVNFCSYCIIPYARGPIRSLPIDEAVKEARRVADEGIKEIVITGIEIASYGRDLKDGSDLSKLVAAIADAVPETRLRLGSLEPRVITREFCRILANIPLLCHHFHLSLQSGCDATLKRMNRKYDTARFYESVELLREFFPGCGLTADLITGFPGEDEDEFAQTMAFIEKCAFSSMHVFPYSIRPGTVAAAMPLQNSKSIKKERATRAIELAGRMSEAYMKSCVGGICSVLFESGAARGSLGHAENYCEVWVEDDGLSGQIHDVEITGWKDGVLMGKLC
ncbi:MAG: tRNA (N(6)-L-threonylcarbamoyladenosine(37)-C(2))-methylthiotransferase MtaB [Clostridiales bacterium]|nr:tRNA (N(6)-L-threonylcarbamoyladenosine(37)-C(2))-methylthiotransferase MtaB [Clostridiales bacterium]